jgi:hypothetical protein
MKGDIIDTAETEGVIYNLHCCEDDGIAVICSEQIDGSDEVIFFVDVLDSECVIKKSTRLIGDFPDGFTPVDFIVSNSGDIVIFDYERIYLFGSDGVKKSELKTEKYAFIGFFGTDAENFAVFLTDEGTEIAKINFDDFKIEKYCMLDCKACSISRGTGDYDVFLMAGDVIYGYDHGKNTLDEVFDRNNSDIVTESAPEETEPGFDVYHDFCVLNEDTIVLNDNSRLRIVQRTEKQDT